MKLSIKKIAALPVGKTIRDSGNLYFKKTKPDGGKWCFRYQKDGRNREMGLGPYPVISIEYARKQAHQNQILLYEREDPLALKQKSAQDKQQRLSHLFSDVARAQKKPQSFPGEKSTGALSQRSVKYYSGRRMSNP